jgi:hypothetical protein
LLQIAILLNLAYATLMLSRWSKVKNNNIHAYTGATESFTLLGVQTVLNDRGITMGTSREHEPTKGNIILMLSRRSKVSRHNGHTSREHKSHVQPLVQGEPTQWPHL